MESVLHLCDERFLLMYHKEIKISKFTKEKLIELLQVADRYQLHRLCEELCLSALGTKLDILEEVPLYDQLSVDTKFKVVNTKLSRLGKVRNPVPNCTEIIQISCSMIFKKNSDTFMGILRFPCLKISMILICLHI